MLTREIGCTLVRLPRRVLNQIRRGRAHAEYITESVHSGRPAASAAAEQGLHGEGEALLDRAPLRVQVDGLLERLWSVQREVQKVLLASPEGCRWAIQIRGTVWSI